MTNLKTIQAPKFAVILSGSGMSDGSEIHEATCALLAIDEHGGSYQCFAPDIIQSRTVNHYNGKETSETRHVLIESARIARGEIKPLVEFNPKEFDAIVFPGGFGAALNLSDFGLKGANGHVNTEVERAIKDSFSQGLVIGAICIAPTLLAKVLGSKNIKITIGDNKEVAAQIESLGAIHENCTANEACIDSKHKIATTPAYMRAKSIKEVHSGIDKMIKSMIEMI